MEKSIKQIASRVLGATDPNTNLETEEAQKCIYDTASRACESTVAGRLRDVFPSANLTEEAVVQIDPSQLKINEGPQHELLATSMMDEVITQFDPRDKANISWVAPQDSLDYESKVTANFRQLERNWRELKDRDIDLRRMINNPVSESIANSGGSNESLYRLGRTDDTQHWMFPNSGLITGPIRRRVTTTLTNTVKAAQVARATVGDLYFAVLDHPPARGPGAMVVPAEASEGHVQLVL